MVLSSCILVRLERVVWWFSSAGVIPMSPAFVTVSVSRSGVTLVGASIGGRSEVYLGSFVFALVPDGGSCIL